MTDNFKYKFIKRSARMHVVQRVRGCDKSQKHTHVHTWRKWRRRRVSDSVRCSWKQLNWCSQKWRRAHVVSMQRYSRCTPTKYIELRVDVVMTTRVLFVEDNEPETRRYHLWHNLVKQNHCPAIVCVMLCNMSAVIGFKRECWLTSESCPTKYIGLLLRTAKPTIT